MAVDVPQSQSDLERHLEEQLQALEILTDQYDQGADILAKQMAGILRLLFHQTKNSHSLLGQLDKLGIQFFDTACPPEPNQITSYSGLVMWAVGGKYFPLLDSNPQFHKQVDFQTWWNSTVLIDGQKNEFSRSRLILLVADKDGGAHVDPTLPADYAELSRSNSLGRLYGDGVNWFPVEHPELASVRQIAHEVLKTLRPGYTKTVTLPPSPLPPIINTNIDVVGEPHLSRQSCKMGLRCG